MFGQRILILVPHPDDEVVACGATIGRAQAEGAEIFTLHLTTGCVGAEALWPWQRSRHDLYIARRRVEAEKVAQLLHITPTGFSLRPTRSLIHHLPETAQIIRRTIAAHQIDQLWVPAYEGGHADHDAINGIASTLRSSVSVLEFAEYNYAGGQTRANAFPSPNGKETILRLTEAERHKKRAALDMYHSEKKNLGYVGTDREAFRPLAGYDYTLPPHKGRLWYARFQWVPFRHPRIDFTKPSAVCEAISTFARTSGLPESAKR